MTREELKRIRLRLGLSQSAFAKELGVTRNTVTRWETGVHPISPMVPVAVQTILARRKIKAE